MLAATRYLVCKTGKKQCFPLLPACDDLATTEALGRPFH
jgi:hypothetical protein